MFDIGHKKHDTLTDTNNLPNDLNPFQDPYKQKLSRKTDFFPFRQPF